MKNRDPRSIEERVARIRELLDRDPEDQVSWFGLGRALIELGRCDEAVDALRRATALQPDHTASHRDLGRSLLESGQTTEAAEVFARAICLAEKTGDVQTGREIHVFLRRAEKALAGE